jgi:cellulose synthase/poly-beta-1,6-N-acetylglucosamine synthase-like glycosyltransferase
MEQLNTINGYSIVTIGILTALPTVCFPLFALLLAKIEALYKFFLNPKQIKKLTVAEPNSIDVIIPFYNDSPDVLAITVNSVKRSLARLKGILATNRIIIVFDGTETKKQEAVKRILNERRALSESGTAIHYVSRNVNRGKWYSLYEGAITSQAAWIAFVDVGTIWPESLVATVFKSAKTKKYAAVAPGYRPNHLGVLSKLNWWLETQLKMIENLSGGPVSVHGATVFYDRAVALYAFDQLNPNKNWLNDDIVLPLYVRSQWKIRYLGHESAVGDIDHDHLPQKERNRRARIAQGNLQWLTSLYKFILKSNLVTAVVAARRITRIFWAYLVTATLLVGVSIVGGYDHLKLLIAIAFIAFIKNPKINAAYIASIKSPLLLLKNSELAKWS